MSSGNTHEAFGKGLAILSTPALAILGAPPLPILLGQLTALFLASPDVDTKSKATKRWGLFEGIWSPLQARTKHRGITHNPFVGPVVVIGYLAIATTGFVNGFRLALAIWLGSPFSWWMPSLSWWWVSWFMVGAFMQYWLHLILDKVSSWWKSRRKKRGRRRR